MVVYLCCVSVVITVCSSNSFDHQVGKMVIPMDKETKRIKNQNVDTQGYSEYEIFQK